MRINDRLHLLGKWQSQLGRNIGVSQAMIAGIIVTILSDNPSMSHEIVYDGELSLIGRVVAIVRKI